MSTFTLLQLSDCHLHADTNTIGYQDINPYQSLCAVFDTLRDVKPDAIVISGDISNDYSHQSYQHLLHLMDTFFPAVTYRVLPGNHDEQQQMRAVYPAENCWETPLQLGNWHIHCLDTQTEQVAGALGEAQINSLTQRLAGAEQAFHLLAMHHPPMNMRSWMDDIGLENLTEVQAILTGYPQIRAAICGHVHTARELRLAGVEVMSCPSTCWQWAHTAEFGLANEAPGARLLTLYPDGQISSRVIRA